MVIITGTSRGIGKALAELYLSRNVNVIGISRTSTIEHPNYTHIECDLSSKQNIKTVKLPMINQAFAFIHNAGILGEVGRFSELTESSHEEVMQVNFHAGVELLHLLIKNCDNTEITAVFVSSGAGKRPIASWASYCASKAAVDLFLETVQAEENEKNDSYLRVYSVSPGVVDTEMQSTIRNVNPERFSSIDRFKQLKENNGLRTAEDVAISISKLIQHKPETKVLWNIDEIT